MSPAIQCGNRFLGWTMIMLVFTRLFILRDHLFLTKCLWNESPQSISHSFKSFRYCFVRAMDASMLILWDSEHFKQLLMHPSDFFFSWADGHQSFNSDLKEDIPLFTTLFTVFIICYSTATDLVPRSYFCWLVGAYGMVEGVSSSKNVAQFFHRKKEFHC